MPPEIVLPAAMARRSNFAKAFLPPHVKLQRGEREEREEGKGERKRERPILKRHAGEM